MILPIIAYGNPILRKKCNPISENFNGLDSLIQNMWDTMYAANGVGLAAPQIGESLRIFIVDTSPFSKDNELTEEERKKIYDQIFDERTLKVYKENFKLTEKSISYDQFVKLASEK